MGKVFIVNRVGNFQAGFRLPASVTAASDFCKTALDGKWAIYKFTSSQGDPNYIGNYQVAKVTVRDEDTGQHYRLEMWVKPNVTENDIKQALSAWTGAENIIVQLTPVVVSNTSETQNSSGGSGGGSSS